MNSFIKNLYYGNIEPQECRTHITKTLKEKLSILSKKEEDLKSNLSDEVSIPIVSLIFFGFYLYYKTLFCLKSIDKFLTQH